ALDDQRPLLARDRRAGAVEPVKQVALAEKLPFGRVDVFRLERVVLAQLPCLEADDAAARVGDREEQPALEVVVAAAIDQSRACQLLPREVTLRGLARERRRAGREARSEERRVGKEGG